MFLDSAGFLLLEYTSLALICNGNSTFTLLFAERLKKVNIQMFSVFIVLSRKNSGILQKVYATRELDNIE